MMRPLRGIRSRLRGPIFGPIFGMLLGLLLCGSLGCAAQTLSDRLRAMTDAQNAGHVDVILSYFDENARVENDGLWVREGHEQLRDFYELQRMLHSRIWLRDIREQRDRVICNIEEENDLYELLGIGAMRYRNVTVIFGELGIERLRMRRGAESRKVQDRCQLAFVRWAREWRRAELERLIASEGPEVTLTNVELWMTLLREYAQTNPEGCR